MEYLYDDFEIVHVTKHFRLFDSEAYQRRYRPEEGHALMPGYYVVSWPDNCTVRRFDLVAKFRGPYSSQNTARIMAQYWQAMRVSNATPSNGQKDSTKTPAPVSTAARAID